MHIEKYVAENIIFQDEGIVDLTESQKEILKIWNNLSIDEQKTVLAMLRGLQK